MVSELNLGVLLLSFFARGRDKDACFREYFYYGGNCTLLEEKCPFEIDSSYNTDTPGGGILGAGENWTNGLCFR